MIAPLHTIAHSLLGVLLIAVVPAAIEAAPEIQSLPLRGLQSNSTTTLVIQGTDLLPEPRLLLPVPIASQTLKPNATPTRIEIEVKLSPDVSPGLYPLRVANGKGVSNAVLIGIDDLPQVPLGQPLTQLPAAVHGRVSGSETARVSFTGKKGERVQVEIEAVRLGSTLNPVIELLDPRGVPIAYAQAVHALNGDARLEKTLPSDGNYTVAVHDALFRAGGAAQFRLKIGNFRYADLVFPLGGQRGTKATFQLIGNLPPDARATADLTTSITDLPVPLPRLPAVTGPAPRIILGEYPEVIETPQPMGKLQDVTVPAAINGRLGEPREEDRYRLLVQPGMALRFGLQAERLGSPIDGVLSLRNAAGAQVAGGDDRPETTDPGLDFTVPDGVKELVVVVSDLQRRGGSNFVYRLNVTPANQPDFSLALFEDRQHVPQGGTTVARVRVNRIKYNGPIKLWLPDLPAGVVVVSGDVIPAGATDTLLSLSAAPGAAPTALVTRLVGSTNDPQAAARHAAQTAESPVTRDQPWLREELAVAVAPAGPLTVAWDATEPVMARGGAFDAKVKVARAAGVAGAVRLSLLTSQIVPKTADGKADDMNRALRVEGTPTIPADQSNGLARVLVPADLPATPFDLAVRAELLGPDGKQVLASAVTPSRRVNPVAPFTVQIASSAVEGKSGGPMTRLLGKVVRTPGFAQPVNVTLTGLPMNVPAPKVDVPADKSDFELALALPKGLPAGDLPNVRVTASAGALKAGEVPVTIKVAPADPTPTK